MQQYMLVLGHVGLWQCRPGPHVRLWHVTRVVEQMEDRGEAPTPAELHAAVAEFPNVHSVTHIQVRPSPIGCRGAASIKKPAWSCAMRADFVCRYAVRGMTGFVKACCGRSHILPDNGELSPHACYQDPGRQERNPCTSDPDP